jgi:hypothetical protein
MTDNPTADDDAHRLPRRRFIAASAAATAGLAGCLGDSGDDAPDDRPDDGGQPEGSTPEAVDADEVPGPGSTVVEDPPDVVYRPTHREAFAMLPMRQVGEYAVMPHYTYSHTFWLMRGDDREEVAPESQSLHLMFAFWDAETGAMLPVAVGGRIEVFRDGERIAGPRRMWPMISQGMGFHFGDNVPFASEDHDSPFPEAGSYEIDLTLDPIGIRKTGAFADRFERQVSTTVDFDFSIADFEAITDRVEYFDEQRRGEPGAMDLRDGGMMAGGGDGGSRELALPPAGAYPGRDLGVPESHDAAFVVRYLPASRLADGGGYLLVSPRTPYNRVPLPDMALSVEGDIEGELTQTLDSELGYHYGTPAALAAGDTFELVVESPPQVARHQGYETAFIEMPSMSVDVPPR